MPIDSPLHNNDTELDSNSNPLSFSPSAPPLQTTLTTNNNSHLTTLHLPEIQNLHNLNQNNPLQINNPCNEITPSSQLINTAPSAPNFHNLVYNNNHILQNAEATIDVSHNDRLQSSNILTPDVIMCSPRRLRPRR